MALYHPRVAPLNFPLLADVRAGMDVPMDFIRYKRQDCWQDITNADCADEDIDNRPRHYRSPQIFSDFAGESNSVPPGTGSAN